MTSSKAGQGLAKVLGIKLDQHNPPDDRLTRGESSYSVDTAETYYEQEPHTIDYLREITPSGGDVVRYIHNLFPFTKWILRYNVQWLIGDLVAGITVGAVVVPQSMAYAKLAELPVEYGLYSSFMGVLLYWFFATSKDITIGPVAVASTLVGQIVLKVQKEYGKNKFSAPEIASALAIISGGIICFLGLARLGFLVEFIPLTAICAFMTGSAISIAAGQVPGMMGIVATTKWKGFNTRDTTYKVIINTLKYLGHTQLDAAMGLSALVLLYLWRYVCNTMAKKQPARAKLYFFIATLRTAIVILLYTMISWLVQRNRRKTPSFKILGAVPRGFQHAGVPRVDAELISAFGSELPATVIVLLIEHIAISKSFGRINGYTIDPSQELVAIGVTNLIAPFLGGYPATGSFSRTAIKSKAGVRTPLAGVITALVVLLAIYALPAVFFYIPNASLSAVIIHAVGDLITPPNTIYQFWRVNPFEVLIFFIGVFITIFSSIENGIYATISISAAILLFRVVKARGHFMGKVKIHSVIGDHLVEDKFHDRNQEKLYDDDVAVRNTFLPLDGADGSNPSLNIESPYPGVFIYRFSEGFNYPNANHYLDHLAEHIFLFTRRTNPASWGRPGDRPWNNPGPRRGKTEADTSHLPTLKAVILDFSAVNNVDITSVQILIDVRNQLQRHAAPDTVQWHMACVNNRWTKRALASAGFGFPPQSAHVEDIVRWKPIYSVTEIGGSSSAAAEAERRANKNLHRSQTHDEESLTKLANKEITTAASASNSSDEDLKNIDKSKVYASSRKVVVGSVKRPFFHIDVTSALQSAIANIQADHSAGRTFSVAQEPEIPTVQ